MTIKVYQGLVEVALSAPAAKVQMSQMAVEVAIPASYYYPFSAMLANTWTKTYVVSARRQEHVCQPGQHMTMTLSSSFPFMPNPADDVVAYEYGTKVLTGWVVKATKFAEQGIIEVECDDTYFRVINTFIAEQVATTAGHDTKYWVNWIMEQCGIGASGYTINSKRGGIETNKPVPKGIQLGLRTAHESLADILAFSSWYVWVDADGIVKFGPENETTFKKVTDGIIDAHRITNADNTRNVVKVYGGSNGMANTSYINVTKTMNTGGLLVDMTTVIGAPLIQTTDEATRVAQYLLNELGPLTETGTYTIEGDPTLRAGKRVAVKYSQDSGLSLTGILTSFESEISADGYTMNITVGERCPRISGWSTYVPPVYAGTQSFGAWISHDTGLTWGDFNTGLPGGTRYVKRIAANLYGEAMAIVNNELYYNPSGTWSKVTLPTPDGGGSVRSLVAVDAYGLQGGFAVLATGGESEASDWRTWVYETSGGSTPPDSSGSTASSGSSSLSVTSTRLSTIDETTGSESFAVRGYDLSSRSGAIYVLASTTSGSIISSGSSCQYGWVSAAVGNMALTHQYYPEYYGAGGTFEPAYTSEATIMGIKVLSGPTYEPAFSSIDAIFYIEVTYSALANYQPAGTWSTGDCVENYDFCTDIIGLTIENINQYGSTDYYTDTSAPGDCSDGVKVRTKVFGIVGKAAYPGGPFNGECKFTVTGTKRRVSLSMQGCSLGGEYITYYANEHASWTSTNVITYIGNTCTPAE